MKNKGFTLIELLVVIAIIGILSSVVLASLNSARVKGRDAKRISDLSQIKLANELFFDSNRRYANATSELVPDFIPNWPTDPLASNPYYDYTSSTTASYYVVSATLEDSNHQVLSGDVNGDQTGENGGVSHTVNCDGNVYCVAP